MSNLDTAVQIASRAHAGQFDKAGQPYILHPLRVMLCFESENEMIVSVLHDVIEDSQVTINDLLHEGFSEAIIDAISCLTKKADEDYFDFIARVSKNKLAKSVKIEDLKDNLKLSRLREVTDGDLWRIAKYHKALKFLLSSREN